jgi:hypothetical protein
MDELSSRFEAWTKERIESLKLVSHSMLLAEEPVRAKESAVRADELITLVLQFRDWKRRIEKDL